MPTRAARAHGAPRAGRARSSTSRCAMRDKPDGYCRNHGRYFENGVCVLCENPGLRIELWSETLENLGFERDSQNDAYPSATEKDTLPNEVISADDKKVVVRNLETGEELEVSRRRPF